MHGCFHTYLWLLEAILSGQIVNCTGASENEVFAKSQAEREEEDAFEALLNSGHSSASKLGR